MSSEKKLKIAMLSPVAWRTPPKHYGPWEQIASWIAEGLVKRGAEVTLFATKESITAGKLHAVAPTGYEEDPTLNRKVWECLHISEVFEHAEEFDLIHSHFDFLPLTYSQLVNTPLLTTIHGFSSPNILPVYRKYNGKVYYVSISNSDRQPDLKYAATVYHGIDLSTLSFQSQPEDYLIFFSRISHDKGTREAIEIAQQTGRKLIIAGIAPEKEYYETQVKPYIDNKTIVYVGSVGPIERNNLLGNAAALLHPIHFNEPFGLSIVEAMACGTPVIAFNRGSMPELIVDKKTGFLVSTVDEAVAAVGALSSIDRQACRHHIEKNFTADRMVEDYLRVYQQILQ